AARGANPASHVMTGYASSTTARRQPFRTSVRKNRRKMPAHQWRQHLMNHIPIVPSDDGWGHAAAENAERAIKGTQLKCQRNSYKRWPERFPTIEAKRAHRPNAKAGRRDAASSRCRNGL